jgi:hypothetical protein
MKSRLACPRPSRLHTFASLGAVAILAACGAPLDASLADPAEDAQELVIGQADVDLVSYGPSQDACGVTACYSVTGLARPEVSHFIIGTPDGCDGQIRSVTLDGVLVANPDVGDFAQRGCSAVHGIKFDVPLAAGQTALVCIAYDQELTLGEVDFQVKAGRLCEAGAIPGPTCNAEEKCDGRDNDCDGQIDEGFDLGGECSAGLGACEAAGTYVCAEDGDGSVCNAVPGEPGTELCGTGIDEDCDGETDEGFDAGEACDNGQLGVCAAAGEKVCTEDRIATVCNAPFIEPGVELCGNGLDDDCDGETDEGFQTGAACSAGVGACQADGEIVCTADLLGEECNAVPGEPSLELCGTGIDEDCDGETDEGFQVGLLCSAGIGACENTGLLVCSADGTATVCSATPLPPGEEVCNGIDDDCDGEVDEDLLPSGEQIEEPVEVDIGQALVTLISHLLDAENGTTQVCYEVGSDFSPSLSHYVVGTDPSCDEHILSVTIDGVAVATNPADHNQANQGCAPIHGIKDDRGMNGGDTRAFCIVYDGLYELGELSFQAKAGQGCESGAIDGVVCNEIDVCPVL